MDLTQLGASDIARLVRKGKVSAREVVTAFLDRIDQLNASLNAYVEVDREGALAQADTIDLQARDDSPSLLGVPISIKSSVSVAGLPWECGSRLREGVRGTKDAPLVSRLRNAGAIVMGVTNVPEFLMSWETDNLLYGKTLNPWDPACTAGGSSGGESAAIAAGLSAGGVGSDGGGSIRVPAHFTGICGLKPTPGRVPITGHFPVSAGPFSYIGVVGPMARTVTDTARLYEAMAGPDRGDPAAAPVPVGFLKKKHARHLTIGYFEDDGQHPVAPEVRSALRRARQALEDQGLVVRDFRPSNLADMHRLWWNLFGRAVGALLAPMVRGREQGLSPILRQFNTYVDASPPLTRDDLMDTLLRRDAVRTRLLEEMEEFPLLLCPVAAIGAFRPGERVWTIDGQALEYLDAFRYCAWFNLTGNPGMAVPIPGISTPPVGVQLVGRPWAEDAVLAVARLLEEAVGREATPVSPHGTPEAVDPPSGLA
jgi:Asp-tRNA(Asn)/Glu-tRNA(Gln) amidotransferase A subunit family amidase